MPKHLSPARATHYHDNGYVFPVDGLGVSEAEAAVETIETFER